jgi:nucleotide-binding universal stress UspA family protein
MNVLVIALDAASPLALDDAEVFVVAPALNSRLRHWLSDDRGARRVAGERLAACLDRLERSGLHASGRVGDADPLQAVADTLPSFAADEIVIAAHPERSRGLAEKVLLGVRERFALPVHDSEAVWHRAAA